MVSRKYQLLTYTKELELGDETWRLMSYPIMN